MTKPKPSYSTTNMQTPICKSQVRCDGINLVGPSRERGYCGKCAKVIESRKSTKQQKEQENE